jgi:hypothetical protein
MSEPEDIRWQDTPRGRLHHCIRRAFADALDSYLRANPQKVDDPDIKSRIKALLALMDAVLQDVDSFDIVERASGEKR